MKVVTIYINTLPISLKSGGIKTFLLQLLLSFAERKNPLFQYCLICTKHNSELFKDFKRHENFNELIVQVDNLSPVKRIYFEQFKLSKVLNQQRKAILLNICNIAVIKCILPQVTIIQAQLSISTLRKLLPKKYISIGLLHKIYYDLLLEKSIKISAKTVAVSDYMVQFIRTDKEKITVIHEGVNFLQFNHKKNDQPVPYTNYILSLSSLFPHKNMNRLIEAYSLFKKQSGLSHKLIIAGKDPDNKQLKILQAIAIEQKVEDDVIFLGWVTSDKIPALYGNAALFVYLSSVEFFGLPVLEAMASNVPVIAANKMSLPEVVNDAGVLVDPDNIQDVARKMQELLTSENMRKNLIEKGKNNIKQFRWDIAARKFENLFSDIADKNFLLESPLTKHHQEVLN
jgi:glycosyltransferase involved in cell wall biosynthesis